MNPARSPIDWRPAVKILARVMAVPAGVGASFVGACVAFVSLGVRGCENPIEEGSTYICEHLAAFVPWVGWPLVGVALLAPFCGGVGACITGRARWLGIGVVTGALACALMAWIGTGLLQNYSFA